MSDKKEFRYEIGGKTYVQRRPVMGQTEQLIELYDGVAMPSQITTTTLVSALGPKLYKGLAVVLTEEGRPLQDKDLEALGEELRWAIEPETAVEVIGDFFVLNPVASILRLAGIIMEIRKQIEKATVLKISSAPSPAETSPGETPSSGDSPSGSANPT